MDAMTYGDYKGSMGGGGREVFHRTLDRGGARGPKGRFRGGGRQRFSTA